MESSRRIPWWIIAIGLLVIAAVVTSVIFRGDLKNAVIKTAASGTASTVSVPSGWKTYTYGKLALAVPATWAVKHDTACQTGGGEGLLLLGRPTNPSSCTPPRAPTNLVAVTQFQGKVTKYIVGIRPVSLNGVPVYYEPINPGGGQVGGGEWFIPSLGVQVVITGPDTDQIGRMLHRS